MKITKEDIADIRRNLWEKSQIGAAEAVFSLISFAAMLTFVIYVLVLRIDRETTWSFFSGIGFGSMTAEYIAWTIHYFAPALIPLIWGILAVKRFEFIRSRLTVIGTSDLAIVMMGLKLIIWVFILYIAGIAFIAADTVKTAAALLALNRKKQTEG